MSNKLTFEAALELATAPRLRVCGRCQGTGGLRSLDRYEEERGVMDTCYHCHDGLITEEQYQDDRRAALVETFAAASVNLDVELSDGVSDEEGGWDYQLAAAENMISVRDYLTECAWAREAEVAAILASLPAAVLADVLAVF